MSSDGDVAIADFYVTVRKGEPHDYRAVVTEHGVQEQSGRMSGRTWLQTANGLVLNEQPVSTIFDRLLEGAAHRSDPRVRVLGITNKSPHQYVMEIRPNARISQLRYFSVRDFLPREVVTKDYDRHISVERVLSYAWIGGTPIPSRERRSDNLSSRTYDIVLARYRLLPLASATVAVPKSITPFIAQDPLPAIIDSMFGPSGILIRADIQGSPYWLKLDSGASVITLDRNLVARLGLHEFAKYTGSKGGSIQWSSAILPRVDIGPLYAKNLVVRVFEHDHVEQGVHVVGLLGCDFIGGRPLDIDFKRQSVTALNAAPPATDRRWTIVATPLRECTPSIRVHLNGRPATLVLDFGAEDSLVNEDVIDNWGHTLQKLDSKPITFIGGDPLVGTQYIVSRASAGGLDFGPFVATSVAGSRAQDLDNDGILGRNVLDNYRVILDYARGRTYFSAL